MVEVEEIPPYEDWLVKDLKAELVARKLNHSGTKSELVDRLYMDDEIGVDEVEGEPEEVEESGEEIASGDAFVAPVVERGWVDGNLFYMEFVEDIGRDDFNVLPTTETHHRLLADTYSCAVRYSNKEVIGGPYDGSLRSKILMNNKVTYQYCVMLKP
jgi:SAP domain